MARIPASYRRLSNPNPAQRRAMIAGVNAQIRRNRARARANRATSGSFASKVNAVLNRKLETKYVAENISAGGSAVKGFCAPNVDALTIVPNVAIQTGTATSNTREGDQIEPVRAKITGHLWWNPLNEQSASKIIFVKMFILQSKTIKASYAQGALDGGWLEDGTPNPVQWLSPTLDFNAFYPVAKKNYTVLKTRTFKFVKNVGNAIADTTAGNSPNLNVDRKVFSYTWTPPTLKYGDDAKTQPNNHYPFMVLVAYSPGLDVESTLELKQSILYDYHREMYYKDA